MAKTPRKTTTRKPSAKDSESQVSDPQATYSTKATKRVKPALKGGRATMPGATPECSPVSPSA